MTTAIKAIEGTYEADQIHSVFGFSVVHNSISTYRGTLDDVSGTLRAEDGGLELEGAARVESISIREPEEFRAHVLGEDFFNAVEHPEVRFHSSSIELSEDGRVRVTGELEVAGITREVTAAGTYTEPIDGPDGNERVAFELETKFDRRDFGFDWQMELPSGGDVLDWDVTLNVHLELVKAGERRTRSDDVSWDEVVGISGSLRSDSHNTRLLRAAAELLPPGAELELVGIGDIPLYNEDLDTDPAPAPVQRLRDAISSADAIVISTPEYNASIPGGLKNAIDWASRPFSDNAFKGKPVLVLGASTGLFGAVWAQAELRKVLNHLKANVLDSEFPVGQAHEAFGEAELVEHTAGAELERQLAGLVELARDPAAEPVAA